LRKRESKALYVGTTPVQQIKGRFKHLPTQTTLRYSDEQL
jgi:hypothetical protein